MTTEKFEIYSPDNAEEIAKVADVLKRGGIAAIPTETVYGLAANALDEEAVKKVFKAKGRPQDNPLIVHISDTNMLDRLVKSLPNGAKECAERFWPGPFTMILPRGEVIPASVSAGLDTVAIRMPSNPVAAAIIAACELPLAAPSANLSGSPSPTTAKRVIEDLDGRVDAVVISHDCEVGVESTVITLCTNPPRLLRPGAVTLDKLREIFPDIEVDKAVLSEPEKDKPVASPGMKYKHYAPKTELYLVEGEAEAYIDYVNRQDDGAALCFEGEDKKLRVPSVVYGNENNDSEQAQALFEALRQLDELGARKAYAHAPQKQGVGLAVYNRIIRAAGFRVIKL